MWEAATGPRPQSAEEPLVQKAMQGDGDAFTRLYDMYLDKVYKHIYYRVTVVSDVEDLTQETFLRAWRSIKSYRPTEKPFVAWLYTIAHNLIIDHYRKGGRDKTVPLEDVSQSAQGHRDKGMDAMLDQDVVRRMLSRLAGEQQQVLMMRFVEGFEYSDVAAALGKSEGAVRVIQLRALRRLRELLEQGK